MYVCEGIPAQLQHKLRTRAKELSGSGQRSAIHLFKEADQWGSKGIVTRLVCMYVCMHVHMVHVCKMYVCVLGNLYQIVCMCVLVDDYS